METGHPSTRAVNSGSGNRALVQNVVAVGNSISYDWRQRFGSGRRHSIS